MECFLDWKTFGTGIYIYIKIRLPCLAKSYRRSTKELKSVQVRAKATRTVWNHKLTSQKNT